MTDKEILQGIDRLEDGIPFDEIRNGNKWLDIHELFSEIRERIDPWHYPEKGDLPAETDKVLVVIKEHRIQADYIPLEAKVGRLKWNGEFFEFSDSDYFKDEIIKWMPIELTEEAK